MKVRAKSVEQLFFKRINPIIRLLIASDILMVGSVGMLTPFFAIMVDDFIVGGNAVVTSIALAVFLISRSILQVPVAIIIDKIKGEKDDFLLMASFSVISSLLIFFYLFIDTPLELYLLQALLGISVAITYPSYMAIFTRHTDPNLEGTEWGLYYTITDIGTAALTVIAGTLVDSYGSDTLVLVVGVLSLLGAFILLPLKWYLYAKRKK